MKLRTALKNQVNNLLYQFRGIELDKEALSLAKRSLTAVLPAKKG